MMLSEQYSKGEFLDRLDRDINRRSDFEAKLSVSVDNNCTFTPGINSKSKALPSRSSYDLSKGDLQRRENKQRMIRLKTEQELQSTLTFRPQISKRAQSAGKSYLELNSDSSIFLEKLKIEREKLEEKRMSELNQRRMHELDGCTFQPETKECPSYVKRIAKSMALVRAARAENNTEKVKPQWR